MRSKRSRSAASSLSWADRACLPIPHRANHGVFSLSFASKRCAVGICRTDLSHSFLFFGGLDVIVRELIGDVLEPYLFTRNEKKRRCCFQLLANTCGQVYLSGSRWAVLPKCRCRDRFSGREIGSGNSDFGPAISPVFLTDT